MLVRQLEDEVVKAKTQASQTNPEVKAHMEALQVENDHLTREIAILREGALHELRKRTDNYYLL